LEPPSSAFLQTNFRGPVFRASIAFQIGDRRQTAARDAGIFAMLLLAASPLVFRYAQEVRMYAQGIGLLFWGNYALLRGLNAHRRAGRWWVLFIVVTTAMLYTHSLGLLAVAAQAAFALGYLALATARGWAAKGADCTDAAAQIRRRWRWAALSAVLILALFTPWIGVLAEQSRRVSQSYWKSELEQIPAWHLPAWRLAVHKVFIMGDAREFNVLVADGMLAVVAGVVLGLAWRGAAVDWLLAMGIVVPVLGVLAMSWHVGRGMIEYYYVLFPACCLLAGTARLLGRIPARDVRWLAALAIVANLAFFNHRYWSAMGIADAPDARGAADFIAERFTTGDLALADDPRMFFPLKYYARGRFPIVYAEPAEAAPFYYGTVALPSDKVVSAQVWSSEEVRRAWVVQTAFMRSHLVRPSAWKQADQRTFRQALFWRGELLVTLWASPAAE
jgi:uncharacterized membrane protein